MWSGENYMRPVGHIGSKSAPCSPVKPFLNQKGAAPAQPDLFHVIHKVPLGDSPYVKAKHVQLVDKDPDAAIALFWAAINAGDRVDSALKDMAIVMKQQNRPEEAIEAIKSLRYRCSDAAQESLDNVLLDLYKRCGRLDDQIALLKHKLHLIHQGMAFNGKRTKTARSQGKKFQVSIEQEATRLLGNLGWAYMQQSNFLAAEAVYRKALSIGPDNNKVCNLGICLMKQGRLEQAKAMLQSVVPACPDTRWGSDSHLKSYERAQEMLLELEASMGNSKLGSDVSGLTNMNLLQSSLWQPQPALSRQPSLRSDCMEDQYQYMDLSTSIAGALSATAGFGPTPSSRPGSKKLVSRMAPVRTAANIHHQAHQFETSLGSGWEEYEADYSSPDENVDTNIQGTVEGVGYISQQSPWHTRETVLPQAFQLQQNSSCTPQQFTGGKKLDRTILFHGLRRENNDNSIDNIGTDSTMGAFSFQNMQASDASNFAADASNFAAKCSSSKSGMMMEARTPLTYDRTNVYDGSMGENETSKLITSGWGNKASKNPLPNSEQLSFFSRWGCNENKPAVRRSLSLESFETQLEQIALGNAEALAAAEAPSVYQPGNVKRPRNVTPTKEYTSVWGSLGFSHTPEGLSFTQVEEEPEDSGNNRNVETAEAKRSAQTEEEMRRQRRLRVFQEMTLFPTTPGSNEELSVALLGAFKCEDVANNFFVTKLAATAI